MLVLNLQLADYRLPSGGEEFSRLERCILGNACVCSRSPISHIKTLSTLDFREAHEDAESVPVYQYVIVGKPEGKKFCYCWYVWS